MTTINLTQGKCAIVDDSDYDWLSQYKWYARKDRKSKRATWYALRQITLGRGRQTTISMHRLIMGFPKGEVDHKDRNGLNNQRGNLRLATDSQQMANRIGSNGISSTGYRGVSKHGKSFQASIKIDGKTKYLGTFEHALIAAHVYDAQAKLVFGPFAVLNFGRGT